ncbi:MAG: hypothetical protein HY821_07065 [Acidobacteria bacterium]|nr:hypothetical protein [Acidobacteriota bacterium]
MHTILRPVSACAALLGFLLASLASGQQQPSIQWLDNAAAMAGHLRLQHSLFVTGGMSATRDGGTATLAFTVLRPDLSIMARLDPATPAGCSILRPHDIAFDGKDKVAISFSCWDSNGKATDKVAFFGLPSGTLLRLQTTSPTECLSLDFAQNGDLLCAGADLPKVNLKDRSYALLYRYDQNGVLVSESIRRDTVAMIEPIELWTSSGDPRVLSWGGTHIVLWYPRPAIMIVADASGKEIWRQQIPATGPDATYSIALSPDQQICAFVPNPTLKSNGPPRYQMACLADDVGNAVRPSSISPDRQIQASWKIRTEWQHIHRAGRSTKLIGFMGESPLLWNRTDSQILTLPTETAAASAR